MKVRRAEKKDTERVDALLKQVNRIHHDGRPDLFKWPAQKYSKEELERMFGDDKNPVFVAVNEKDETVGYCFTQTQQLLDNAVRTDIKTLYIDDLCVDENCRHMHIGETLLKEVMAYAKTNGYYNITLNVWALNDNAIAFYKACGMEVQKYGLEKVLG